MIQVSFFKSKAPKHRKVCIAKWARFWTGPKAELFAPSNPKAVNWAEAYRRDLENRFPTVESLLDYLDMVEAVTPNPILCCFEVDPQECHRTILADFIERMTGVKVREWSAETDPVKEKPKKPAQAKKPELVQCSLV